MKHEINVETRAVVRNIITTIRQKHNCNRAEAERLYRRAASESDVIDALLNAVEDDIENERWMASENSAE